MMQSGRLFGLEKLLGNELKGKSSQELYDSLSEDYTEFHYERLTKAELKRSEKIVKQLKKIAINDRPDGAHAFLLQKSQYDKRTNFSGKVNTKASEAKLPKETRKEKEERRKKRIYEARAEELWKELQKQLPAEYTPGDELSPQRQKNVERLEQQLEKIPSIFRKETNGANAYLHQVRQRKGRHDHLTRGYKPAKLGVRVNEDIGPKPTGLLPSYTRQREEVDLEDRTLWSPHVLALVEKGEKARRKHISKGKGTNNINKKRASRTTEKSGFETFMERENRHRHQYMSRGRGKNRINSRLGNLSHYVSNLTNKVKDWYDHKATEYKHERLKSIGTKEEPRRLINVTNVSFEGEGLDKLLGIPKPTIVYVKEERKEFPAPAAHKARNKTTPSKVGLWKQAALST